MEQKYKAKKSLGLNTEVSPETSFKKKKSLGQNFLKSEKALSSMIDAGDIHADDIVLEIGPGKGVLTEKILKLAGKVIVIEKDRDLIPILKEKFEKEIKSGKLDLIDGDCLEFDIDLLKFYKKPYKLVANIPYYITGAIIRRFLEAKLQPEKMVLLVQKEVADRIVGKDPKKIKGSQAGGKESLLSLSVKAYGTPKYIDKVSRRYFSPEPKVDSAIISIQNISRTRFASPALESKFFEVIHVGFAHKRKVLISNLSLKFDKNKVREIFDRLSIQKNIRAEDIPIEKWLEITELLY